jgi:hypothetical protein
MRRYVRQTSLAAHIALTLAMVGTACGLLAPLSPNLTTVFLVAVVFISLLCPRWLVRIHKFKVQINGPWDEAVRRAGGAGCRVVLGAGRRRDRSPAASSRVRCVRRRWLHGGRHAIAAPWRLAAPRALF